MNIMQILPYNYNINFGTSYKKTYKPDAPHLLDHEASTCFFKYDFQWNKGFDFFIEKYKNTDKVNVYSLASSDGSEALSIAMILDTKLKERAYKFFPIIAVDNDSDILSNIKNGYIDLSAEDEVRINHYTNNNLSKYLKRTSYTFIADGIGTMNRSEQLTRYIISPELLSKIKIVNADVNDFVETMGDKDNLIFARNFWVYLRSGHADVADDFLKKLSEKADKNSYLVIGNYDFLMCPLHFKNCYGFSMNPEIYNLFDKSGSNYFDEMHLLNRHLYTDY